MKPESQERIPTMLTINSSIFWIWSSYSIYYTHTKLFNEGNIASWEISYKTHHLALHTDANMAYFLKPKCQTNKILSVETLWLSVWNILINPCPKWFSSRIWNPEGHPLSKPRFLQFWINERMREELLSFFIQQFSTPGYSFWWTATRSKTPIVIIKLLQASWTQLTNFAFKASKKCFHQHIHGVSITHNILYSNQTSKFWIFWQQKEAVHYLSIT